MKQGNTRWYRHAFRRNRGFLSTGGAELIQQGGEETHTALSQVGVQAGLDLLHSLAYKAQAGWKYPLKQLPGVGQYQLTQHLHSIQMVHLMCNWLTPDFYMQGTGWLLYNALLRSSRDVFR